MITYAQQYRDFGAKRRPPTDLISTASRHSMTDSQLGNSDSAKAERTSVVRVVLWTTVGIALIVGLVLFFRYTRLMTPLL
jgi:predicted secreted protein